MQLNHKSKTDIWKVPKYFKLIKHSFLFFLYFFLAFLFSFFKEDTIRDIRKFFNYNENNHQNLWHIGKTVVRAKSIIIKLVSLYVQERNISLKSQI